MTLKKAVQITLAVIMVLTALAAPLSAVNASEPQGTEVHQVAMWVDTDQAGSILQPDECNDGSSGNGCGGG